MALISSVSLVLGFDVLTDTGQWRLAKLPQGHSGSDVQGLITVASSLTSPSLAGEGRCKPPEMVRQQHLYARPGARTQKRLVMNRREPVMTGSRSNGVTARCCA